MKLKTALGLDVTHLPRPILTALALVPGMAETPAAADPISVGDFSFEIAASAPNAIGASDGALGAWTYERTGNLAETLTDVSFASNPNATDGSNVAQLVFLAGADAEVSLFQDSGIFFQPNRLYTLTFDVDQNSIVSLLTGASASIFDGATAVATLANESFLTLLDMSAPLQTVSLQFATGAIAPSGTIGIGFTIGGAAEAGGSGLILDNVRLDITPAPEPATTFLLALAAGWLHGRRRRPAPDADGQTASI